MLPGTDRWLLSRIKSMGLDVHISVGDTTIVGLVGDTTKLDRLYFSSYDIVQMF